MRRPSKLPAGGVPQGLNLQCLQAWPRQLGGGDLYRHQYFLYQPRGEGTLGSPRWNPWP